MDILRLTLVCLKVGTFVFGGGMSMMPLLEQDVVTRYGWLTQREFVDALALGQMTPGPLLVTVTFIGWRVGLAEGGVGLALVGATVATIGIFLPSFLMTILVTRQLVRLKGHPYVQGFLRGVIPGVIGLLLSFSVRLAQQTLLDGGATLASVDLWGVFICAVALVALLKFKLDAVYVILAAGLVGWWVYQ